MKKLSFIKNSRLDRRLTLKEVSKKTGLSISYLCEIENDDRDSVPYETFLKIAQALDIDIDVVMVNMGQLPESFFLFRKKNPEELTKELKRLLKRFETKHSRKGV